MADALGLHGPVELGFKFVPFFRLQLPHAERQGLAGVVDEQDGIDPGVPAGNLDLPHAGGVVAIGG